MKKTLLILFFVILTISCEKRVNHNFHPDLMKPNWDGIKVQDLKFKIGDVISIFIEKQYYIGIVMDFNKDEAGIWYGISLSDYRKTISYKGDITKLNFFGRKIPSGFKGDSINCFDLFYLSEKGLNDNITIVENIKIDINKISIGSLSPVKKISQLETDYFYGIKKRLETPSECGKDIFSSKRIDEKYFKIGNFLLD